MILQATCQSCQNKIEKTFVVGDRVGLAKDYGESQVFTCVACSSDHNYHVDELVAIRNTRRNYILLGIAVGLSLIFSFIFSFVFNTSNIIGFMIYITCSLSPFVLLLGYLKFDTEQLRAFNKTKLKGRNVYSKMNSTSKKKSIATVKKSGSNPAQAFARVNKDKLPTDKKK